jgi:hypothetical protein
MNLSFPNGREIRVNARHDFPGHSMWNPTHGPMRAAQMGWRDHILVCGHKHKSGYDMLKDPSSGMISHCVQVSAFQVDSNLAVEKGFLDQHISPCPAFIIDPDAERESEMIQFFPSLRYAAQVLTWKRAEWKAGKNGKKRTA